MPVKAKTPVKVKAKKSEPAEPARRCHFCKRDERLQLVRLIMGNESRLIWTCPDHRG